MKYEIYLNGKKHGELTEAMYLHIRNKTRGNDGILKSTMDICRNMVIVSSLAAIVFLYLPPDVQLWIKTGQGRAYGLYLAMFAVSPTMLPIILRNICPWKFNSTNIKPSVSDKSGTAGNQ